MFSSELRCIKKLRVLKFKLDHHPIRSHQQEEEEAKQKFFILSHLLDQIAMFVFSPTKVEC